MCIDTLYGRLLQSPVLFSPACYEYISIDDNQLVAIASIMQKESNAHAAASYETLATLFVPKSAH